MRLDYFRHRDKSFVIHIFTLIISLCSSPVLSPSSLFLPTTTTIGVCACVCACLRSALAHVATSSPTAHFRVYVSNAARHSRAMFTLYTQQNRPGTARTPNSHEHTHTHTRTRSERRGNGKYPSDRAVRTNFHANTLGFSPLALGNSRARACGCAGVFGCVCIGMFVEYSATVECALHSIRTAAQGRKRCRLYSAGKRYHRDPSAVSQPCAVVEFARARLSECVCVFVCPRFAYERVFALAADGSFISSLRRFVRASIISPHVFC